LSQNIKIVIYIEQKKKIFSNFYAILRSKNSKMSDRQKVQTDNRYRRNMSSDDVIQALSQMGVTR
jgi:hypothetical protein